MIVYFKKIRYKVIHDKNYRFYVLYAIGEIFLVMVGILLALQVNNWNHRRENRTAEHKYLQSIRYDLSKQDEILTGLIKDHGHYITYASNALNIMDNNTYQEKLDSLYIYLRKSAGSRTFSVIYKTYDELKSTGDFEIMMNSNNKERIIEIYRSLHEIEKISMKNNLVIEDFYSKYIWQNKLEFYSTAYGIANDKINDPKTRFTIKSITQQRRRFATLQVNRLTEIKEKISEFMVSTEHLVFEE